MQNYPYYITDTLTKYYQRFQVTTYAPLKAPLIYGQKTTDSVEMLCISDSRYWIPDPLSEEYRFRIPNSEFQSFEGFWTPRLRIPDSGIRITFRGAIQSKEHRMVNIQTESTEIRDFSPKRYSSEYLKYLHDVLLYGKKKSDRRRMRRISNQKHNKKIIIFKPTPKLSHRHKRSSYRVVKNQFLTNRSR